MSSQRMFRNGALATVLSPTQCVGYGLEPNAVRWLRTGGFMRGNTVVIAALNKVLTRKLTAINQYFLHARMFKNWGFATLNSKIYKASIEEMKHADDVIERILLLDGLPNLQELGKLYIGEEPAEMLKLDDKLQTDDIRHIRDAISVCETEHDFVSRQMLAKILEQQEEHQDWLDTQRSLIETIGVENYLQQQL